MVALVFVPLNTDFLLDFLFFSLGIVLWEIATRKKPFEGVYLQNSQIKPAELIPSNKSLQLGTFYVRIDYDLELWVLFFKAVLLSQPQFVLWPRAIFVQSLLVLHLLCSLNFFCSFSVLVFMLLCFHLLIYLKCSSTVRY